MLSELDSITGQERSTDPTINDIESYYPEGVPAPKKNTNPFTPDGSDLSGQVTSPGAMTIAQENPLYATPYANINKGSYSGSIVGNIPIFVDSQMISFAPEQARQQQLQIAAAKKAKEIKDLESELYKVPQLKNAPDQPEMNDMYINGIEKWKQMYGGDVVSLQKDPRFIRWREDVKTAGKINDAAYEQYAQMGKEMDEGKKYFSPETRKSYQSFLGGLATLGDPTNPQAQNFTSKAFKLNQSYDLDMAVDELKKGYEASVTETDPEKIGRGGIYDILQSTKTTGSQEEVDKLGKWLYKSKYEGTGTFTEQEVINRVKDAIHVKTEKEWKTPTNQFAPRENKGDVTSYDVNQKEAVKNVLTTSRQGKGETSFDIQNVFKTSTTDQAKKISFPVGQGLKYTDGTPVSGKAGYVEGNISDIGVAKVYKPGLKLPVKVVKDGKTDYVTKDVGGMAVGSIDVGPGTDPESPAFFNYKPVAMFNVAETQGGASGKGASNKTVIMPLSQVINHYAKAGKKPGELDLTDMAKDVEANAKAQEKERLAAIAEYNASGKNQFVKPSASQKKSVTSGNKGGLKPTGDL